MFTLVLNNVTRDCYGAMLFRASVNLPLYAHLWMLISRCQTSDCIICNTGISRTLLTLLQTVSGGHTFVTRIKLKSSIYISLLKGHEMIVSLEVIK